MTSYADSLRVSSNVKTAASATSIRLIKQKK